MKFLFFFLAFVILKVNANFKCPVNSKQEPINGAFRDPLSCEVYHNCFGGVAFSHRCPPNHHVKIEYKDLQYFLCVQKNLSACTTTAGVVDLEKLNPDLKTLQESKTGTEVSECQPGLNSTVGSLSDARLYYNCVNGVGWPQICPDGMHFNPYFSSENEQIEICNKILDGGLSPGKSMEKSSEPAFMVSLKNSMNVNRGIINWTSVDLNIAEMFNPQTNDVSIKKPGLYFFSMTATSPENKIIDLLMQRTGKNIGLLRQNYKTATGPETISRSGLFVLSSVYKPILGQLTPSRLHSSENGKETSWLGFRYESDNYLFCGSHKNLEYGTVNWQFVSAMRGFQESSTLSHFRVSTSGIYFLNAGMRLGFTDLRPQYTSGLRVNVDRNYNLLKTPLQLSGSVTSSQGISDTFARTVLTELKEGDVLRAETHRYASNVKLPLSGARTESYMTSFKLNTNLPYFQAVSTDSTCNEFRRINLKSIYFDSTKSWSSSLHEYTAKKAGVYYIEFTMSKLSTSKVDVRMFLNRVMVAVSSKKSMINQNSQFTRSLLLNLKVNDKIHWENYGCVDRIAYVTIICTS